jgi:hypothetical protein
VHGSDEKTLTTARTPKAIEFSRSHAFRVWFILLILAYSTCCLAGEGQSISISVAAAHTKANGKPWDGILGSSGPSGPMTIPILKTNGLPDLAICVVRLGAPPECRMRYVDFKQYSLCQNSFTCIFERVSIPEGPFGLIILDLDLRRHDVVDLLMLTAGNAPPPDELAKLERETRRRADKLAPMPFYGKKQRRLGKVLVLPLDRCAGAKGCTLVQSEIRVNLAE